MESAQRNCTGNVMSIQHCYRGIRSNRNTLQSVCEFFVMNQTGLNLNVIRSFTLQSTPDNTKCVRNSRRITCCDTAQLTESQQFLFPSSLFAFGMEVNTNSDIQPLAFASSATEYVVNGFREASSSTMNYSLSNSTHGLAVMKFLIGKMWLTLVNRIDQL